MTGAHLADAVLRAYAEDRLADADAWSVEAHLDHCPACRDRLPLDEPTRQLVETVGTTLRERLREGSPATGGPPFPGRVRAGTRWRRTLVLVAAGPVARTGWLLSVAVTLALALAMEFGPLPIRPWLLLLVAPVLPVLGVAASYGPHTDPLHELVGTTPYGGLRMVLWRTLSVLAVTVPVALVAGEVSGIGVPVLWLLPCLTLTALTLGLGALIEPYRAGTAVALGWAVLVLPPSGDARLVAPAAVPGWLAGAAVAVLLLVAGNRMIRNRMTGGVTG